MVVIALDTNFVAPRVIHGGRRNREVGGTGRRIYWIVCYSCSPKGIYV